MSTDTMAPAGQIVAGKTQQSAPPIEIAEIAIGQAVRQGDVLVQRIESLPEGAVPRRRRDLAIGVRASHLAADPAQTYEVPGSADIWIRADARWAIEHDEHAWFVLPPGTYRSWRQRETIGLPAAKSVISRVVVD